MPVDSESFGEVKANVNNLLKRMDEMFQEIRGYAKKTSEDVKDIHKRIDTHMDKEEKERLELLKQVESVKSWQEVTQAKMSTFMWVMAFGLPIVSTLLLFLLKVIVTYAFPESGLAVLLSAVISVLPA